MKLRLLACLVLLCSACASNPPVPVVTSVASPAVTPAVTGRSSVTVVLPTATTRKAPVATAKAHATSVPTHGPAVTGASIGGCPLFPSDNEWRRDVSKDPVDPRSDAYVTSISSGASYVHPDFGSNPDYGIPFVVVPKDQKKVPITFNEYGDESDKGPYPIPLNAKREVGSDHHVLVVRKGECKLYELYHAARTSNGWSAGSGAVFNLNSNALRPAGWTSADAAGLPILPGLVRRDETKAGAILHALRFTASQTQAGYVDPARHKASSDTNPNLPPMGLRMRLKASYDISRFHGQALVVLKALKTYGMILADNGSSWYITGANDTGWNDQDMNQLKSVPGSSFEAVKHGTVHP